MILLQGAQGPSSLTTFSWLHQLTATEHPTTGHLSGRGVRDRKAMIATLRYRLIHHAGQLDLRLPPGHDLLNEVLAPLRSTTPGNDSLVPSAPCTASTP